MAPFNARYAAPGYFSLPAISNVLPLSYLLEFFGREGRSIFFKAFIENFVENFNPNWKSEVLYGRADPVYIYENTTRSFSLRIAIPSATQQEAYENLGKVQKLAQFLYPN